MRPGDDDVPVRSADLREREMVEPHFSTKTNGTGLGLASVRQLMERQGGGLSIASAPHRGTTIDLWLPVMSASFAD